MPKGVLAGDMLDQFIEEQSTRHPLQMEDLPRIVRLLLKNSVELFERDRIVKEGV